MATIRVHNEVQKVLYNCELAGQISDGMWENSVPHNHWKVPSGAVAVVNPTNPGLDFRPIKSYAFPKLIEFVGDRMQLYAQARILYQNMSEAAIRNLDHGEWMFDGKRTYLEGVIQEMGVTSYAELVALREKIRQVNYTVKDLKKDLHQIQKLFQVARK